MPVIASRREQGGPAGAEGARFARRSKGSRRANRALVWLVGLALLGVLASLGSGLIPDRAHPELVPQTVPAETAKAPPPNGWGPYGDFKGRYHIRNASIRRGTKVTPLTVGQFSFAEYEPDKEAFEEEGKEPPKVQSGLLYLHVPTTGISSTTELLFFSELSSDLHVVAAKVRASSYTGPIIGYFAGSSPEPGRFSGTATLPGVGTIHAEFVRFSKQVEAGPEGGIE